MLEEQIQKIIELRHDAPYSVLGPHPVKGERALTVRAFLPHAERAYLLSEKGGNQREMERGPDGLFVSRLPATLKANYQLMTVDAEGQTLTFHDPYAIHEPSWTPADGEAFQQGDLSTLFSKLGAHPQVKRGIAGVNFAVWAPNASRVSVVGTFNQWDGRRHLLERHPSGVWEVFIPGIGTGELYKYEIRNADGAVFLKPDPMAFATEVFPKNAALVCDVAQQFAWTDSAWRADKAGWTLPMAIHRVAFGEDATGEPGWIAHYEDLQTLVLPYVLEAKFTHVELALWGIGETVTSYYTPNPRYGHPEALMAFIDACHQQDIAVLLDWIPPLLPREGQELSWFDGSPIYETEGVEQPDRLAFNLERPEVRAILLANAQFWHQVYHIDAICTDVRTYLARLAGSALAADVRVLIRENEVHATLPLTESTLLAEGRHNDPHAILGPHPLDEPGLMVIRALLPDAEMPCVLLPDQPNVLYPLQWVPEDHLFEAIIAAEPETLRYRLNAIEYGNNQTVDDPYATIFSFLGDQDCYLFAEGNHYRIYEKLGAHRCEEAGICGINFAVWAPNAQRVSVVGPFNYWDGRRHPMRLRPGSGIWELFVPGLDEGALYKFEILPRTGPAFLKTDPFAFHTEVPPGTASVVYDRAGKHEWHDAAWMQRRAQQNVWEQPIAIYEVHAGSWRRHANGEFLNYRELADHLIPYVLKMGFTHIEFLPLAEHPYGPSWGYQISNFYAPTARFGQPGDLMELIDRCHQNNIGVILDWVPAHFPKDAHAMAWYDGTCLFEHADPRQGEHPDWGTLIFNFGRHEVENFLIANALYWLDTFHFDGLRVDAVASMLYLDYSKKDWIPNQYGGNENLEAIEFLRHTNAVVHANFPGALMIAEESTAWPNVSRPTEMGGLGFGFKWNMGWMHDVLFYLQQTPENRRYHHHKLTFSIVYAFNENFILSLSHDEVVHLKKSLLGKMPGTEEQQFANLRLLYTYMYGHPGKKLLFMGGEFGQTEEWRDGGELQWELPDVASHQQLQQFFSDLNKLYACEPACHQVDFRGAGFEWLDANGAETNVIGFVRKARDPREAVLFILNFSDQRHEHYRIGVPYPTAYRELLNSNAAVYGGTGETLAGQRVVYEEVLSHGFGFSIVLNLPAFSAVVLKPDPLEPIRNLTV